MKELIEELMQRRMWARETAASYREMGDKYGMAWFEGRVEGLTLAIAGLTNLSLEAHAFASLAEL